LASDLFDRNWKEKKKSDTFWTDLVLDFYFDIVVNNGVDPWRMEKMYTLRF